MVELANPVSGDVLEELHEGRPVARRLVTVEDAAEALAMSRRKVYDEIHAGRLRAVKTSLRPDSRPHWRIPVEALDEFVAKLDDNQIRP